MEIYCPKCGDFMEFEANDGTQGWADHSGKATCPTCKHWFWPPKDKNKNKRHDNNQIWRDMHREKTGGKFICGWCLVREMPGITFQCDHMMPLEHGGKDEFENTWMLCSTCHTKRHADQTVIDRLWKVAAMGMAANKEKSYAISRISMG
jgi:DNA-directed RNA polymerase subunit M/transcription elongation factor TFIIS